MDCNNTKITTTIMRGNSSWTIARSSCTIPQLIKIKMNNNLVFVCRIINQNEASINQEHFDFAFNSFSSQDKGQTEEA